MKIYPNPIVEAFTIEIPGNRNKLDFEVFNVFGQRVYEGNLIEKTIIQAGNWKAGIYLLKIKNGGTFTFNKIIKK